MRNHGQLDLPVMNYQEALQHVRKGKEIVIQSRDSLKWVVISQDSKLELTQKYFKELEKKYSFYLYSPEEYAAYKSYYSSRLSWFLLGSIIFTTLGLILGTLYFTLDKINYLSHNQALFLSVVLTYAGCYCMVSLTETFEEQALEFEKRFSP